MSGDYTLHAKVRKDTGKGASRRLRRLENLVPGIVYGGQSEPVMITMPHKDLVHESDNENFFTSIINLEIDGKGESVVVQDFQRHPAKPLIMHVDFKRVEAGVALTMNVPLHFINEENSPGVKVDHGIVNHLVSEIEIQCLPKDLPEYIEVDMGEAKLGDTLHLSDLKLPEGVESTALAHGEEHDLAIASVIAPRATAAADDEDGEAADTGSEEADSSEENGEDKED